MGIFVDYIPIEKYKQMEEDSDKETLFSPNVSEKTRLKLKNKDGNVISKFNKENFSFDPFKNPRKCAIWSREYIKEDCWLYMYKMGGQPPIERLFKGTVKKEDEKEFEIKYYCKENHKRDDLKKYDEMIVDMSEPDKDYNQYNGL